jgi:hypothetical protein
MPRERVNPLGNMGDWVRPTNWSPPGEVVEWLMAPVLKTGEAQASVGSNPTLSVSTKSERIRGYPKTVPAQSICPFGSSG